MEPFDPIIRDVIIGIILAGGIGLIAYVKKKFNSIDKLCNRITTLEKTILLMATAIEQQTKLAHPDIDTSNLKKMIDIMMKNHK